MRRPTLPSAAGVALGRVWPILPGLATGAYLGYQGGYIVSQGGMAALGAFVIVLLLAALVGLLGIAGTILVASRAAPAGGRRLLLAAAGALVGGVAAWAAVPTFGLGYRPPVTLHASGAATVQLDDQPEFSPVDDGPAECWSVADSTRVGSVWALDLGELEAGTLRATLNLPSGETGGHVELFIDGADVAGGRQPFWSGSATVEATSDGGSGHVRFAGLALHLADGPGAAPPGLPAELGGRLSWTCEPWIPADRTPPPAAGGELLLSLPGEDLQIGPGDIACEHEDDGTIAAILASGAYRLQGWPLAVEVLLPGQHRLGAEVQVFIGVVGKEPPPGQRFMPNWVGFATIETLGDGERTGTLSFEELATGVDPSIGPPPEGWPATLTGTVAWTCG